MKHANTVVSGSEIGKFIMSMDIREDRQQWKRIGTEQFDHRAHQRRVVTILNNAADAS